MSVTVQAAGANIVVNGLPGECPRCHRSILAQLTSMGARPQIGNDRLQIALLCPACNQLFIAAYRDGVSATLVLVRAEPTVAVVHTFGNIDEISPQFASVYNEAVAAEAYRLNEIAGLAYRKSLEFLIKDYCIRLVPAEAEQIKSSSLSCVIKTHFKDTMIGKAAEKAAWLGNDEAHYVRKWGDHDINSLKSLLRIVVSGVNERLEFDTLMASFESKAE